MRPPAVGGGPRVDVALALGVGVLGAAMAVFLPALVSLVLVLVLLGGAIVLRFGAGGHSGGGAASSGGGPLDLAGGLLICTAFTIPMNRLVPPPLPLLPVSDVLLALAFGLYVLIRLAEQRRAVPGGYAPIFVGLGMLALGGLVGSFFEVDGPFMYQALGVPIRDVSGWSENMGNLINFVGGAFLPMTVWMLARPTRAFLRRVLWAFVAGCTVSALIALIPYGRGGNRLIGMTVHPNQLGSLSMMGIGVLLGLLLSDRRRRVVPYLAFPILAYAVLGSGSRAALGGVAVLALIIGPATRSRAVMGALVTGLAALMVVFATGLVEPRGENAVGRVLGESDTAEGSDAIREALQTKVWDRFEQRPLTGNGYNYMRPSHNVYLGLIASAGLLGVVGLGVVISTVLRRAWRRRADLLAAAVASTYVAYLANAYFDNIFWMRWLWFFVGMVAAAGVTAPDRGEAGYSELVEPDAGGDEPQTAAASAPSVPSHGAAP